MNLPELIEIFERKSTSGNNVPVERITFRREEFEEITKYLKDLRCDLSRMMED